MPNLKLTTRLAPSPTGALHLGNARTFYINWLLARQNGWNILLRIEDLDGPRIKRSSHEQLLVDLAYMGLNYDRGPVYQSHQLHRYQRAVDQLLATGHAYPCVCTRREVALAASAPHAEDGATIYPGACRGRFASPAQALAETGKLPAIRFAAPDRIIKFHDAFAGDVSINVARELGDFVIAKADGTPAYQLAVVVDDLDANVTDVVRGDDLLQSTPRQMLIYEALGAAEKIPRYTHVPLVVGPDGRRLAKRHGDTRLETYRQRGVPGRRLRALLAKWCGIDDPDDALNRFSLDRLPRQPITFTVEDEAFLLAAT